MSGYPGNQRQPQNPNVVYVNAQGQPIQQQQQQVQYVQQGQQFVGQQPQVIYAQQPPPQQAQYGQPQVQYVQQGQQPIQYVQQQPQQQRVVYAQQPPQQQQQYGQPPPNGQIQYVQQPQAQQPQVQYVQQPQYGQQQQPVQYVQQQQPQQSAVYAQPKQSGPPPPSYNAHKQAQKAKTIYEMADEKMNANNNASGNSNNAWNNNNNNGGNDSWTQPRADAKGTCAVHPNFNEQVATEAAKELRKAMKGMGCDKKKVAEVTGRYNAAQRAVIRNAFCTIDQVMFGKGKQRNLLRDLKSELGGSYEKLVCACYEDQGEYDARLIVNALAGIGYDSALLIEVICTRTNKQINAMKSAWTTSMRKTKSMTDSIKDETKKIMSGNNFQSLMMQILEANRPQNTKPNDQQIQSDAETLNRFIKQEKKSDAKSKFVEIFVGRSWAHIAALCERFSDVSKKYTIEAAIKKSFGDGSDTSQALRVIASFCSSPYDYWAKKLRESMKGLGTKDDDLIRVVVTRSEIDMHQIKNIFGQRYGNGKTLKDWITKDTSGAYKRLLLLLCGYE